MMPGAHRSLKTFANRHAKDVIVHAPAQPDQIGLEAYARFELNSFKAFSDRRVENRLYKVFFVSGEGVLDLFIEKSGGKSTWTEKS